MQENNESIPLYVDEILNYKNEYIQRPDSTLNILLDRYRNNEISNQQIGRFIRLAEYKINKLHKIRIADALEGSLDLNDLYSLQTISLLNIQKDIAIIRNSLNANFEEIFLKEIESGKELSHESLVQASYRSILANQGDTNFEDLIIDLTKQYFNSISVKYQYLQLYGDYIQYTIGLINTKSSIRKTNFLLNIESDDPASKFENDLSYFYVIYAILPKVTGINASYLNPHDLKNSKMELIRLIKEDKLEWSNKIQ